MFLLPLFVATPAHAQDPRIHGYVQPQLVWSQLSEDEVSVEGTPLNQDRFLIRRARLGVDRMFTYAGASLEVDFNTVDGPHVSPSKAELSVFLPNPDPERPATVALTAGLSRIPFGFELPQGGDARFFMERSRGSRALFPGENDVGAKLSLAVGPLRAVLAAQNGVPLSNTPDDGAVSTSRGTSRRTRRPARPTARRYSPHSRSTGKRGPARRSSSRSPTRARGRRRGP